MTNEFRPGSFQILPTVIKNLLIINVLVFVAQLVYDGVGGGDLAPNIGNLTNTFALHSIESPLFRPWQIITHMFMHGGIAHIFLNMFALWMFGSVLENIWGPRRFFIFYMICGIGAAAVHLGSLSWEYHSLFHQFEIFKNNPSHHNLDVLMENDALAQINKHDMLELTRNWPDDPVLARSFASAALDRSLGFIQEVLQIPTLGASDAVFGCLAAFGYLFHDAYINLSFSMKAKWFVLIYIGFELMMVFRHSAGGIARWAHLGGALVGFLLAFFWERSRKKKYYL